MEVQHPKNNNYLGVDQQPEQGNGPVFTPSSQIIASKVQSPIHKLEDFDDNNQKFKFSDVSANKGGNKDDERMLPSQRF